MKRALLAALLAAGLGACGGDGRDDRSEERRDSPSLAPTVEPTPTPTPTSAPGDPPVARAPSAPPPPLDATGPEGQPGGAGDEEAIRTRVRVVVDGEGVTPPRVEVPAFLALRVTVRNDLPRRISVKLEGDPRLVGVRARSTRSFNAEGLRRGEYALDAGSAGRGVLVAR